MRTLSDGDELVRQSSGRIVPIKVDLSDLSNLQEIYDIIAKDDKNTPFVGLIHNAALGTNGPFEFEPQIRSSYEVNLIAPALMTQKFFPLIRKNQGRVVFISSLSKFVHLPFLGPYVSTKSALDGLANVIRAELALFGAHASIVASGQVQTDMLNDFQNKNHILSLDKSVQKTANDLYGCYYSKEQTDYRNSLLTMFHTTKETNDAMFHAVTSPYPRNDYLLGTEGFLIGKILSRLPSWVLDLYFRRDFFPGPYCYQHYNNSVHWTFK